MAVLGHSQPLMYGQQIMQMPDGSFTQTVAYGTVAAAAADAPGDGAAVSPTPLPLSTSSGLEDGSLTVPSSQSASGSADLNASADDGSIDDGASLPDAGMMSPNKTGGGSQVTMNNRYRCSECARGLSTGFSLKRHMHTVHGMSKVGWSGCTVAVEQNAVMSNFV